MKTKQGSSVAGAGAGLEALESRAYLAAGGLDPSFGTDGSGKVLHQLRGNARDFGEAAAVQKDGKIVVAGITRASEESENGIAVARFNSDGSLDTTFGAGHDGRTVLK